MNPFDELRVDDFPPADDGRLNALRVRAVVAERRAAERRRTWRRVGFLAAMVLVIHATVAAATASRSGNRALIATYVAVAALASTAGWTFRPRQASPALPSLDLPPPDFTGLGDGSHFARNLDQIYDEKAD